MDLQQQQPQADVTASPDAQGAEAVEAPLAVAASASELTLALSAPTLDSQPTVSSHETPMARGGTLAFGTTAVEAQPTDGAQAAVSSSFPADAVAPTLPPLPNPQLTTAGLQQLTHELSQVQSKMAEFVQTTLPENGILNPDALPAVVKLPPKPSPHQSAVPLRPPRRPDTAATVGAASTDSATPLKVCVLRGLLIQCVCLLGDLPDTGWSVR